MPIGDAPTSIADSPMAIGDAPIPMGERKCSPERRQSPSPSVRSPLPRLQSPLPDADGDREGANADRRDGNAFRQSSNGHFRRSETYRRVEMLFAETEMRCGKPANSLAIAPMDLRKGRMRFSATKISVGKAPMAVGVTAMRIAARGKEKGEGARCGTPPRGINYRALRTATEPEARKAAAQPAHRSPSLPSSGRPSCRPRSRPRGRHPADPGAAAACEDCAQRGQRSRRICAWHQPWAWHRHPFSRFSRGTRPRFRNIGTHRAVFHETWLPPAPKRIPYSGPTDRSLPE